MEKTNVHSRHYSTSGVLGFIVSPNQLILTDEKNDAGLATEELVRKYPVKIREEVTVSELGKKQRPEPPKLTGPTNNYVPLALEPKALRARLGGAYIINFDGQEIAVTVCDIGSQFQYFKSVCTRNIFRTTHRQANGRFSIRLLREIPIPNIYWNKIPKEYKYVYYTGRMTEGYAAGQPGNWYVQTTGRHPLGGATLDGTVRLAYGDEVGYMRKGNEPDMPLLFHRPEEGINEPPLKKIEVGKAYWTEDGELVTIFEAIKRQSFLGTVVTGVNDDGTTRQYFADSGLPLNVTSSKLVREAQVNTPKWEVISLFTKEVRFDGVLKLWFGKRTDGSEYSLPTQGYFNVGPVNPPDGATFRRPEPGELKLEVGKLYYGKGVNKVFLVVEKDEHGIYKLVDRKGYPYFMRPKEDLANPLIEYPGIKVDWGTIPYQYKFVEYLPDHGYVATTGRSHDQDQSTFGWQKLKEGIHYIEYRADSKEQDLKQMVYPRPKKGEEKEPGHKREVPQAGEMWLTNTNKPVLILNYVAGQDVTFQDDSNIVDRASIKYFSRKLNQPERVWNGLGARHTGYNYLVWQKDQGWVLSTEKPVAVGKNDWRYPAYAKQFTISLGAESGNAKSLENEHAMEDYAYYSLVAERPKGSTK